MVLIDFDRIVLIDGNELRADLILIKGNFAVPALGREETGGLAVERHLEGEGERKLANLALVLVRSKVKQIEVLFLHDLIVSVMNSCFII